MEPDILIVDDELGICRSLARNLADLGCRIHLAGGGAEGLALLDDLPDPALVISDLYMPAMDGAEFLALVRERCPKTERVLLTGYCDLAMATRLLGEGIASRYVIKPWDPRRIRRSVEAILRSRGESADGDEDEEDEP